MKSKCKFVRAAKMNTYQIPSIAVLAARSLKVPDGVAYKIFQEGNCD